MEIVPETLGLREKRLKPGLERVRWTCSCGLSLYDDFIELQPGGLGDLKRRLEDASAPRQCSSSNSATPAGALSIFGKFFSRMKPGSWSRRGNRKSPQDPGRLPTHHSLGHYAVSVANLSAPPTNVLYLLVCINSGNFGVELHHESIGHIKSDRALFHFLRESYAQRRSILLSAISLRTISSISLVKFAMDMSARVDIHPHLISCDKISCICVPPKSKVEPAPNSEYRCNPIPAPHIPPIGENYMMHLFSSPGCINSSQVWVYNQFPKRMCGRLMGQPDEPAEGWGVHFQEGWDWPKIWAVILILFLGGSTLFGVLYAALNKDVQSAFGIASYWITTATILLGYLATRNRM
ncbi:hypothetical protein K469DRAFT_680377 [Zopfia rhizophila CBS 207.26]|uniref:Uncharacterized protein n=1 Tax=Zopfia rhizophila CBS 207.26 TaxID=1314779 RepID=A0A6A6DA48_9PEZI|nr:hypothetical protein K469DRAFT_680377 [Zopfia rhizophila CBS 207.26]